MTSAPTDLDLLDRKEASALLHISQRTLDRIADLPRITVGNRRILFRRADIVAYINRDQPAIAA